MALKYVQTLTLYQAGAGNIIGATSVVLTSLTDIYGNAITSMTPFGTKGYITLEPDTTNEEGATFTGITVNANNTTTLTGVSTILAQSPYTETSGLVRQHAGGSKVVVTDNVAFWNTFGQTQNANEWAGIQTFDVPAVQATDPTSSSQVANKHYVDNVAIAGAPNASPTVKGIVQEATQAQVLAKTNTGSTGADLYVTPTTLPSTLISDYKVDTGTANVYAIAPAPVLTAYVTGNVFSFKATNANTGASTLAVSGLATKPIVNSKGGALVANDILANMIVTVEYDGTSMVMQTPVANAPTIPNKFGGTGADGVLDTSSGTVNINLGNAAVVVKNYSSINVATNNLTFTNPNTNGTIVILKSQNNVTISATIVASGLGGAVTNSGIGNILSTLGGSGGTTGGASGSAPGGAGGAGTLFSLSIAGKRVMLVPGAGGNAGGTGGNGGVGGGGAGGTGGTGGGALYVECGGALNFSGTVTVAGSNGTAGAASGSPGAGGGGGGGGGGTIAIIYNILTTNSGTLTVTGGTAGAGGAASPGGNGVGGGGGGGGGGAGANGVTGSTTSSSSVGSTGGAGGVGVSYVVLNTEF